MNHQLKLSTEKLTEGQLVCISLQQDATTSYIIQCGKPYLEYKEAERPGFAQSITLSTS